MTDAEKSFWDAYYNIVPGVDSDWYSRLKGAAINMLSLHDFDQGTGFTANWPASTDTNPVTNPVAQNTRLGKESVICQKCHADNVIAVVKSAYQGCRQRGRSSRSPRRFTGATARCPRAAASTLPMRPAAAVAARAVIRRTVPTA